MSRDLQSFILKILKKMKIYVFLILEDNLSVWVLLNKLVILTIVL